MNGELTICCGESMVKKANSLFFYSKKYGLIREVYYCNICEKCKHIAINFECEYIEVNINNKLIGG